MTKLLATLALVFIAGCGSKSSGTPGGGGFGSPAPGQQAPGQGSQTAVGFTAHAWCYAYQLDQPVQDRFMFYEGGALNYQMFAYQNGQRAQVLKQGDGQWQISGSVLTMILNNRRFTFQMKYNNPDPATGTERLHVYNGGDAPYDPCP